MPITIIRSITMLVVIAALLAACGSGTPAASEDEAAQPTTSPTPSEEPTPSADPAEETPTSAPSATPDAAADGLAIPIENPCDAMDAATAAEIIGGEVAEERTWEPGDQPFGTDVPPSTNFGCQFVGAAADGGNPEFGLTMLGVETTADEWMTRISPNLGDCEVLEVPETLEGDLAAAVSCANAFFPGWGNVIVHGVFDGTALMCNAYVREEQIDDAFATSVVEECERILLELAVSGA